MKLWIKDIVGKTGETVDLYGWVDTRRDHGKIVFIDLRDRSGLCQAVFSPSSGDEVYERVQQLRAEWTVKISGRVRQRPEGMVNKNSATGAVEVEALGLEILNSSETPPFDVRGEGYEVNEEVRMKYRYLDLRRPRLARNLIMRHRMIKFIRDYLDKENFLEVETPILTKSTPEGARDYVVPSRMHPGNFFALPQAPQQYKQLLMASGVERYFQIARCFRDEDTRGDRQPEFTQLDMELSFVSREEVMVLNEALLIDLVAKVFPDKKIQETPFPRISFSEAMEKYGTDRPDLRKDKEDKNLLAFCWVIDFPFFEKTKEGGWTFTHNPFSAPKAEYKEMLMKKEKIGKILTDQYDVVLNGYEIGGGSIRNHETEALRRVFEIMGISSNRIEKNFGHMFKAFSLGTPPHGGIAWGLDRIAALFLNEPNIREVIAFPKTGDARDLLMDAPSELEESQLKELHLEIKSKEAKNED